MDVLVLLIAFAVSGGLVMLGLKARRAVGTFVGVFGIAIIFLTGLVLSVDGSLTWQGATLAAANGDFISDFNLLSWTPIAVSLGETFAIVLKAFRRF